MPLALLICQPPDFYPRSPCGERRLKNKFSDPILIFLSTLSLRRATRAFPNSQSKLQFLSTLSLRRATSSTESCSVCSSNFYPRSPCGERPIKGKPARAGCLHFYPRSPCGERLKGKPARAGCLHFYPRSPCGERLGLPADQPSTPGFLSTLSLRRAT